MKKLNHLSVTVIMLIALTVSAFSQKNINFTYRYPSTPVTYINSSNIHEVLDIQGQAMDVYVTNVMGFNVKSAGNLDKNLNLQITIDSLSEIVDSPQGMMGGKIDEVKGKSFNISISPNGKVADISGAKNTTYTVPGSGPSNLSGSFVNLFPVFPNDKIDQGHVWTSSDTVSSESGMSSQVTIVTSENKFEGFEEVIGIKCAKISSVTSGTSNMKNEVQGMSMVTKGTFTGTAAVWFSPDAGYFVKSTSTTKMTGNVEMPNEGYSFPVVLDIVESAELKK